MQKKFILLAVICLSLSLSSMTCPKDPIVTTNGGSGDYNGLLLTSTNSGHSWSENIREDLSSITGVVCMSSDPDIYSLLITKQSGVKDIVRTTNMGASFHQYYDVTYHLQLEDAQEKGKGFALAEVLPPGNDNVLITTDEGLTWNGIHSVFNNPYRMDFGDDMHGIIISQEADASISYTTNGGTDWYTRPPVDSVFYTNDVEFVSSFNSTTAVICGGSGKLFRTTNTGLNWTEIKGPIDDEKLNSIGFIDPIGIIAGDNGTVLRSTDSGISWNVVPIISTNNLNKVFLSFSGYYIVGDGVILRSDDQGLSWGVYRNSNTEFYYDMFFIKNTGVVVGQKRR